jgi:molybdenum cofactor biosynthesis protein B
MSAVPAGARAAVVTVSDRAAAGSRPDTSGPTASELLQQLGFEVDDVVVVPDDAGAVTAALRAAIDSAVDLVVTTGGTGLGPRDVTPEATLTVVDRLVPGLAESLRQHHRDEVPTTILSRGVAGVAGRTLIVNLPGSTGGVRDGVEVLSPVIGHAVSQLRGGDHG